MKYRTRLLLPVLALAACLGTGARAQTNPPAPPDAPFVLIANFEISPGREEQFRMRALAFARMAEEQVPGVIYKLHVSASSPGRFVFYEYFPNKAAYERVQQDVTAQHRAVHGPTPQGMFARPPAEERWTRLN